MLRYTITSDAIINFHNGLNDDVGSFEITLPLMISGTPAYNDILTSDYVKVWIDWDIETGAGTPDFAGKIYQITAPISKEGFFRTLKGKGYGEILQRRIKTHKAWVATDADVIVTELADDLGIHDAAKIAAEPAHVTLTVDSETYADALKKVSDYWVSAGVQIKNDYYVDTENELVWSARPVRIAGVSTITEGENLKAYNVARDATQLKNKIYTYGKLTAFNPKDSEIYGRKHPQNGDDWTHAAWVDIDGTTASSADAPKIGASCTRSTADASNVCNFYRTFAADTITKLWVEGLAGYGAFEFWARRNDLPFGTHEVKLYCPDAGNYYSWGFTVPSVNDVWEFRRAAIGLNNTYNAITNPSGQWVGSGSPNWDDIEGIEFNSGMNNTKHYDFDGVCFNFGRWRSSAENAASQTAYGIREMIQVDDNLMSDSACQCRAESLLYQMKDPVIRIDETVNGDNNLLPGDRLSITLTPEGIAAANYYVTSVEQKLSLDGWLSVVTLVDSVNTRFVPPLGDVEALTVALKRQRDIARGIKVVR